MYSSHRALIEDVPKRIDELKTHHQGRIDEAYKTLKEKGKCTVRDIAMNMSWDMRARDFSEFPNTQKFFAAGEAHAHLEHLRAIGKADFEWTDDRVLLYYAK